MRHARWLGVGLTVLGGCNCGGTPETGDGPIADLIVSDRPIVPPNDQTMPDLAVPVVDQTMPDLVLPPPPDFAGLDLLGFIFPDMILPDMAISVIDSGGPPPTAIDHDLWRTYCFNLMSCGFYQAGSANKTLSSCLGAEPAPGSIPTLYATALLCVKNATTCDVLGACLNNGATNYPASTCSLPPMSSCDNNSVRHSCLSTGFDAGVNFAVDCKKFGLDCFNSMGRGFCAFGTCAMNGEGTCIAGFGVSCTQGVIQLVEDCRVFANETCVATPPTVDGGLGSAGCVGTGPACAASRCLGNTLVGCKGGFEATVDCQTAKKLNCLSPDAGARCGLATECCGSSLPLADCAQLGLTPFVDSCNNGNLTYCDAGKITTVSCSTLGFASCGPTPNANAADRVSCIH